ncbi:hypothetical protein AB4Y63_12030 [Leifsonia sp. YAF41]|uniref:hypothetical protein n=1 Tax=Leifsonia sp. YAF41 TaxID=3233086 RepID=UPI003F9D57D1
MPNHTWTETDLSAAADRVHRSVSTRIRRAKRTKHLALASGIAFLGLAGVAAASTLLPPQAKGEIGAGPEYVMAVSECLQNGSWNVWVAPAASTPWADGSADTVHFSVSGYEQVSFMDDVELCRDQVASRTGAALSDVIGLP